MKYHIPFKDSTLEVSLEKDHHLGDYFSVYSQTSNMPIHMNWNFTSQGNIFRKFLNAIAMTKFIPDEDSWEDNQPPAWLPVAFLCCQTKQPEGIPFASKILEASPDDHAPALIACDWLEEINAIASTNQFHHSQPIQPIIPQQWQITKSLSIKQRKFLQQARGPAHLWCRTLIDHHCIHCGKNKHQGPCDPNHPYPKIIVPNISHEQQITKYLQWK